MKSKKEKLLAIVGLVLLGLMVYVTWIGFSFFVDRLLASDPKISAAIIGAMTTIFVGIAAVLITQRQTKLREIDEAHREKKVEIYQKFIITVVSLIAGSNDQVTKKAPTEQELIDYLVDFKTEILLWGSPKVIKAQLNFEKTAGSGGDVFQAVDNLYKAIREDIGLSNSGLSDLELIKIFLKDPDELNKLRASNNAN